MTTMPPPLLTQSTGLSRHRKVEIELRLHANGIVYEYGKREWVQVGSQVSTVKSLRKHTPTVQH